MNPSSYRSPGFSGRFGVARRDITPPLGIYARNWGAARIGTAQSIDRPLTLTVLTIQEEDDSCPFAILSLDLGWWRATEEEDLLSQAAVESGLTKGNFIVALTHTHSGPIFSPQQSDREGGQYIKEYLEGIAASIRSAIKEALSVAQFGLLETVSGFCGLAQNRDFQEPQSQRFLVGWNPETGADQTLVVGRVTTLEGKTIATVVNYACHPTILAWKNMSISPDFIGEMREIVERDEHGLCLFLQGASGDLAPKHQYVDDFKTVNQAGRCLGYAVLSLLYQMNNPGKGFFYEGAVESGAPLAVWVERVSNDFPKSIVAKVVTVDFPLKADMPTSAELQDAIIRSEDDFSTERLRRLYLVRQAVGDLSTYSVDHLIWLVGDIVVVAIPNEIYSEVQVRVRALARSYPVLVITIANGGRGYLVPHKYYDKDIYAVNQSPFARGAMEQCEQAISQEISLLIDQHAFDQNNSDKSKRTPSKAVGRDC